MILKENVGIYFENFQLVIVNIPYSAYVILSWWFKLSMETRFLKMDWNDWNIDCFSHLGSDERVEI